MGGPPLLASLTGDPEVAAFFGAAEEVAALTEVEAALVEAYAEAGAVAANVATRAAASIRSQRFNEEKLREGVARDGVVVPELVRQLRAGAEPDSAKLIHGGATSQDIIDTALMLRLRRVFALLDGRLEGLIAHLERLAEAAGDTELMAHTRMQAALPTTVAEKLRTWREPLERERARLRRLAHDLPVQLGGPVGDGASFGDTYLAVRAALAKRLGLADGPPWHSAREVVMDAGQALALLTGSCGKIGQDVALMAQNEVAAIKLSGGGGSSAMAHKQNPVKAEVLVALARLSAGLLGTLHQAMVHENERSGAAWTLEWMVLPQMAEAAGAALRLTDQLLEGASFSKA